MNNQFHRVDGPAIIYPNGTQLWFINGNLHREDGPARIFPDGQEEWYINGKLHREDGPAVIYPNGRREWWVSGQNITKKVNVWMEKQHIVWPWNEDIQAQFLLTFD